MHPRIAPLLISLCLVVVVAGCADDGSESRPASPARLESPTLTPDWGAGSGGTAVLIEIPASSDDFIENPPIVYFGGISAESVTPLSTTDLAAITPADPYADPTGVHPVDVLVVSVDGLESYEFAGGFTYLSQGDHHSGGGHHHPPPPDHEDDPHHGHPPPPHHGDHDVQHPPPPTHDCMTVHPSSGSLHGGDHVTILSQGTCLWNHSSMVTFGGVPATSVMVFDSRSLVAVTPPGHQPGPVDVEVTGEDHQGHHCICLLPDGFTYH